jgi:hypothetical protein
MIENNLAAFSVTGALCSAQYIHFGSSRILTKKLPKTAKKKYLLLMLYRAVLVINY